MPNKIDAWAPRVVKGFQNIDNTSAGKVGAGRNRKRQAHHVGDVLSLEQDPENDREHREEDGGPASHEQFFLLARVAVTEHMNVDIVRERGRACERQPGHHGQDRGKRNRSDESEKRLAPDGLRQQWRRHVATGVDGPDPRLSNQHHGAEAEDEGEEIEATD